MANKPGFELNQGRLRQCLGMSLALIRKNCAEGMPYYEDNARGHSLLFNSAECHKWVVHQAEVKAGRAPKVSDLDTERARLARMQADRVELDLATKHGELLPFDQVESQWAARIIAFRAKMLALPAKNARVLAAIDDHKEIASLLRDEIDEALHELVKEELESLDEEADSGDDPAGAAAAGPEALRAGRR